MFLILPWNSVKHIKRNMADLGGHIIKCFSIFNMFEKEMVFTRNLLGHLNPCAWKHKKKIGYDSNLWLNIQDFVRLLSIPQYLLNTDLCHRNLTLTVLLRKQTHKESLCFLLDTHRILSRSSHVWYSYPSIDCGKTW